MNTKHSPERLTRRRFLHRLPAITAAALLVRSDPARAGAYRRADGSGPTDPSPLGRPAPGDHPDPRPGIDASNVLTAEELADAPDAIPVYDGIREMPHIADGLRCYCGCADWEGYRSLLTCFEGGGMAMYCDECLGQAELAHRRWKEGQTLDQIRRAIDARYAPPGGSRSASAARAGMAR